MQTSPPRVTLSHMEAPAAVARSFDPLPRLLPSHEEAADLLDAVPHAVALFDRQLRYDYLNVAYARRFGCSPGDIVGRCIREPLGEQTFAVVRPTIARALEGEMVRERVVLERPGGLAGDTDTVTEILDAVVAPRRDRSGQIVGVLVVLTDITEHERTIDDLTTRLSHQTHYDALTGLPNRALFYDHVKREVAQAKRVDGVVSVITLDLDDFGRVNDSLGQREGDALLVEIARRLSADTREGDVLARIGGDQFALLAPDLASDADGMRVAQRLRDALRAPFSIGDREVLLRGSVGLSVCPRDSCDPATLLRYADTALHQAKTDHEHEVRSFSPVMMREAEDRIELEGRLRSAIENAELEFWMQPQVDLGTSQVVGLEALGRWRDRDRGWVSPGVFIPLAEELGLMVELGRLALRASCWTIRRLDTEKLAPTRVAVNVAASQLHRTGFVEDLLTILHEEGVAPQRIEVEITESAVIKDLDRVIERLEELRRVGIAVSLDDFGTGYSSLTHLRRLPIDTVKIDKSFIDPVEHDHTAAGIVTTIVSMAHWLGMKVVAEGIETKAQAELLHGMGCDVVQGYFFARPTPPEELPNLLRGGQLSRR